MFNNTLRQKLEERRAVVAAAIDKLTAAINWDTDNPPPKIAIMCSKCGRKVKDYQLNWGEVEDELWRGRDLSQPLNAGSCDRCAPPDEDDEETE